MAKLPTLSVRFRAALESERPGTHLDDNVIRYLALMLEDDDVTLDMLVEVMGNFLADGSVAETYQLCVALRDRILGDSCTQVVQPHDPALTLPTPLSRTASLSRQSSGLGLPVKGLEEWLEKLSLSHYSDAARSWCAEVGAVDVEEVAENWEEFCRGLSLKTLEWRRVRKLCEPQRSLAEASPSEAPRACNVAPFTYAQVCARAIGEAFFGPSEDPKRYKTVQQLGAGATAKVYKCARLVDGETFAVKAIDLAKFKMQHDFPRVLDKLLRETTILFTLRHPQIVSLYDVCQTPDKLYLVMELVEGGELINHIHDHGALPEHEARFVFLQIVLGLRYVHSCGFAHRDLKPENVLIDARHSSPELLGVKLSDFGHSKLVDDGLSTALSRVGTPRYWAPEVEGGGAAAYDEKVDLWSLGVVLHVMVEGEYPAESSGLVEFKENSRLSPGAKDLVRGLMQQRPRDRFSLEKCLQHDWVARRPGPLARVVALCERHQKLASQERERLVLLPHEPLDARKLRRDLHVLTARLRLPVTLRGPCKVGVCLGDLSNASMCTAWDELMCLLETQFPDGTFTRPDPKYLASACSLPLTAVDEVEAAVDEVEAAVHEVGAAVDEVEVGPLAAPPDPPDSVREESPVPVWTCHREPPLVRCGRVGVVIHQHDNKMDLFRPTKNGTQRRHFSPSFFTVLKNSSRAVTGFLSYGRPAILMLEGPVNEVENVLVEARKFPWWSGMQEMVSLKQDSVTDVTAWRLFKGFNKLRTGELKERFSKLGRLDVYDKLMRRETHRRAGLQ